MQQKQQLSRKMHNHAKKSLYSIVEYDLNMFIKSINFLIGKQT